MNNDVNEIICSGVRQFPQNCLNSEISNPYKKVRMEVKIRHFYDILYTKMACLTTINTGEGWEV